MTKRSTLLQNYLCLLFCLLSTGIYAATYTVSNGNDAGPGSLREAVIQANNNAGADVININSSVLIINLSTYDNTFLFRSLPEMSEVTLNGNGVIIQSTVDSYLTSFGPGTVINDVTLYNFKYGGAAVNCSSSIDVVTFNNCNFNGNTNFLSFYEQGGAISISNPGNTYFVDCVFFNNSAKEGGAVFIYGLAVSSNVSFDGCSFDGNSSTTTAIEKGNAIYFQCDVGLTLTGLTSFEPTVEQDIFGQLNNEGCIFIPVTLAPGFTLSPGSVMRIHTGF